MGRKRMELTLEEKKIACEYDKAMRSSDERLSLSAFAAWAAKEFDLAKPLSSNTMKRIRMNATKILNTKARMMLRRRMPSTRIQVMDSKIRAAINKVGTDITSAKVKAIALEVTGSTATGRFRASNGWLQKFERRQNISIRSRQMNRHGLFCLAGQCRKRASFGYQHRRPARCVVHKANGMVDVTHKICSHCLSTRAGVYAPYCAHCYCRLHPNDSRANLYCAKERAFMIPLAQFLKQELFTEITLDRALTWSRKRPDGLIDCDWFVIIVEVDEDCHLTYDPIRENMRLWEIYEELGCRPMVVVRINPDRDSGTPSVFSRDPDSPHKLIKDEAEFTKRYTALVRAVVEAMDCMSSQQIRPTRPIWTRYLFYNQ